MEPTSYTRRLLHRWLIQYNPLYLLSAMLVLGGMFLSSRGLAREGSLYGEIGVAAIAEIYALTLIGGAALLTRIGQRRPGVMLALLTALYQFDLTLHTETCANLGTAGQLASVGWLVLFVVKLFALAWAIQLRLARRAVTIAIGAATGLAALPYVLDRIDGRGANAIVAVWLFGLVSLFRSDLVTSVAPLDTWGQTVLRRALRAVWLIAGGLVTLHVLFWSTHYPIAIVSLAPVVPLVMVRRIESETRVWIVVAATLALALLGEPSMFAITAFLSAIALTLRTLPRTVVTRQAPVEIEQPYRASFGNETPLETTTSIVPVDRAVQLRLFTGVVFSTYLAAWTAGWSGGPWPAHILALDVALAAIVLAIAWRGRARIAIVPAVATGLHLVAPFVPAPRNLVEWGAAAVVLGFVILIASVGASYRLRRLIDPDPSSPR